MVIVYGTDLSTQSHLVASAAAALAVRLAATELFLVHVLENNLISRLDGPQLELLKAQTLERLTQDATQLATTFKLARVEPVLLMGAPAELLPRFAHSKQAALLVMASQGHGATPLYRIGGTSERVALSSEVPVLVVRDEAPFRAWASGERPLRILVGLDFTTSSDAAVHLAKTLRRAGTCDLTFAHIHYGYDAARRYGIAPLASASLVDADRQTDDLLRRDLAVRVGELPGEGAVTFLPRTGFGRLGDHLLEIAEAERADLILVGTHRRSGARRLASVSSVVLHFGHAAIACAPPEMSAPPEGRAVRHVLIPTDLSPFANYAIAQGYRMLAEGGGEVHLIHVLDPISADARSPIARAELVHQLRALVPDWAAKHSIVTRTDVVVRGDIADAVHETAARMAADMICMASHGRSGIRRAVLGSIAEQVIRGSHISVLVVRPPSP